MEKVKKLSVAEVMRSIEVSKSPLVILNNQACRIYKLIVKLNQPKHVSLQNCQETLRNGFLRALEDAIERHIALLSRINGIKSVKKSKSESAGEDDASVGDPDNDDDEGGGDDDDDDKDETSDDLGSDYSKKKRQNTDSVEYDGSEEDAEDGEEEEASSELKNDGDEGKTGKEPESDDETDGEQLTEGHEQEDADKTNTKLNEEFVTRKFDRSTFVEVKDLNLEVHFRFTNEPEILLAEVKLFNIHKFIPVISSYSF